MFGIAIISSLEQRAISPPCLSKSKFSSCRSLLATPCRVRRTVIRESPSIVSARSITCMPYCVSHPCQSPRQEGSCEKNKECCLCKVHDAGENAAMVKVTSANARDLIKFIVFTTTHPAPSLVGCLQRKWQRRCRSQQRKIEAYKALASYTTHLSMRKQHEKWYCSSSSLCSRA